MAEIRRARRAVLVTPAPTTGTQASAARRHRPVGITLLSILQFLTAATLACLGLFLLVGAAVGGFFLEQFNVPTWVRSSVALLAAVGAVLALALAVFVALLGRGTLTGRPWAWTCDLVIGLLFFAAATIDLFAVMAVVGDLEGIFMFVFAFLPVAFYGLIVWYLFTPHVKTFFDKGHVRALWQRTSAPGA